MNFKLRTNQRIFVLSALGFGMISIAWLATAMDEPGGESPEVIRLTGIVRDFRQAQGENGYEGHPDFERQPDNGFALYCANVADTLDADGKPFYTGGGRKLRQQYEDSAGRPICYRLFDPDAGDHAGQWGPYDDGAVDSAASFAQWYRDVPGINMSRQLTLTFIRQPDGSYVFDDKIDPEYQSLGGFFPIDGDLFGNPGGSPNHNFHFTFELHARFTYDATANQVFRFIGDDDVFVFIDGRMVIDIGGVHSAKEQFVDLNRLGLVDGETYRLDFFFAERHRTKSNFRIVTNLVLESGNPPTVSPVFD